MTEKADFSAYRYSWRKEIKEYGASALGKALRVQLAATTNTLDRVLLARDIFRVGAEYSLLCGEPAHYFITGKEMEGWLKKAAPLFSHERAMLWAFETKQVYVLHFEGAGSQCYLVATIPPTVSSPAGGCCVYSYDPVKQVPTSWASGSTKPADVVADDEKLISGFLAYVSAFPDLVRVGLPETLRHPNHYRKSKVYHVLSDGAKSSESSGTVTPHFRSGHFRLLNSERFTKKRGQVVFVHECFVKGTTKTVEGIE